MVEVITTSIQGTFGNHSQNPKRALYEIKAVVSLFLSPSSSSHAQKPLENRFQGLSGFINQRVHCNIKVKKQLGTPKQILVP